MRLEEWDYYNEARRMDYHNEARRMGLSQLC